VCIDQLFGLIETNSDDNIVISLIGSNNADDKNPNSYDDTIVIDLQGLFGLDLVRHTLI